MLSLHSISKMPQKVYQIIMQKMNQTHMGQCEAQLKPGPEAYICNFHYDGFKGPTRMEPSIILTFFKQPHSFYSHTKKPHQLLDHYQGIPDNCEPPAQATPKPTRRAIGSVVPGIPE